MSDYIHSIQPGVAYTFEFTNYKQATAQRVVIARSVQWGSTPWHKEVQFFLEAFDMAKQEVRSFPLAGIRLGSFRRYTDEEMDVFLTKIATEAKDVGYNEAVEEAKKAVAAQENTSVG